MIMITDWKQDKPRFFAKLKTQRKKNKKRETEQSVHRHTQNLYFEHLKALFSTSRNQFDLFW